MLWEVIYDGCSGIEFNTRAEAEAYKQERIEAIKNLFGDKYLTEIKIVEKWGFNNGKSIY